GTGVVARLAAQQVGPEGQVTGLDLNPGMLAVARALPPPLGATITWVECSAVAMDLPDATFDVVLCQQGLQFFPDKPAALREMHRVLKPNGRAAIAVWTQIELNQIFAAYHAALRATVNAELADLMMAPFSWPSGAALKDAAE